MLSSVSDVPNIVVVLKSYQMSWCRVAIFCSQMKHTVQDDDNWGPARVYWSLISEHGEEVDLGGMRKGTGKGMGIMERGS